MENLFTEKTRWCWHPDFKPKEPCFIFFRTAFDIKEKSCRLKLNVSADNRYNLYLDGKIIGRGPCRSDPEHYNYETYDLDIEPGRHAIAAHVTVFGSGSRGKEVAIAEMHTGSGFLVAGGIFKNEKKILNLETPDDWKCDEDKSRFHRPLDAEYDLRTYTAIPSMEKIDFSNLPRKWMYSQFNDSLWLKPKDFGPFTLRSTVKDPYTQWWLVPRQIPMMEEKEDIFKSAVKAEGVDLSSVTDWLQGKSPLIISYHSKITIDAGNLTTAFPRFEFDGGRDSTVKITYSESLFVKGKKLERDRKDGVVFGYSDLLKLDGGTSCFEPFWFRTFRFVEIEINPHSSSHITMHPPSFKTFMFPLDLKADFETGDCEIRRIWEIAWRTARLCAHEHYYDCPYYEQLQYTGDTRIQALISYSSTGDGRLGRQAILQYDWSRLPEGINQSRYPSAWKQIIVGFSLYWVMMVRDYYEYFGDKELVKEVFPGIRAVLEWFERHRMENGLIGHLRYWNFTDWLPEWPNGNPARTTSNPLTINTMQYAEACRTAAYLAEEIGDKSGIEFKGKYKKSIDAVNKLCFDRKLGLYVDMPGTNFISQHTNSWAIISDAVTGRKAEALGREIFENEKLSKATLYFSFYLFRAWEKVGCYELFWKQLENWKSVLKWNFTTFPEIPFEHTRSDCHAWSASPIYEFLSCVLGVKPGSPGFEKIILRPHLSKYGKVSGTAPVGNDKINVSLELSGKKELVLKYDLKSARPVTIVWPDGKKQDAGRTKSGMFRRALKKSVV
ncbi:MAG TPA: hypothetical protein DCZ94_14030 [Lentisphaeria bacterium]|nr:MAG: hypothetical protein A2X48_03850 [Lentisphaerae bacterium GWF2_49_21]HBC88064.1 hypothetical protein [Lentisphaeria bacterium]